MRTPGGESDEQTTMQTRRVQNENNDDLNYPVKTGNERNDEISSRYIVADITFAADQQSTFYLTTQFNIVRQINSRLYNIGKMVATNNSDYPFIITDVAGTKLWVDSRGNILNGNYGSVGFLKVRR